MPEPTASEPTDKPTDATTAQPAPQVVPAEWLKDIVTAIKEPVAAPPTDPAAVAAKAKADHDAARETARKEAAELLSNGKYEEAIVRLEAVPAPPSGPAEDVTKSPWFLSAAESARDRAERQHPTIFKEYGAEVDTEIAKLPEADRIVSTRLAEAVERVRARHVDDLVEAGVKAKLEEQQQQQLAPQTGPVPDWGETADTELAGLDRNERARAREIGVDYKDYAAGKKALATPSADGLDGVDIPL